MMRILSIWFIVTLLFNSCSKELEENCAPRKRVIEGHLYEGCNYVPMRNVKLILAENPGRNYYGKLKGNGRLDSVQTDSNGHFEFKYISVSGSPLHIKHYSASTSPHVLLERIPSDFEDSDLNLFYYSSISLDVWLNVKNEYSYKDTLVIQDNNPYRNYKIPGPFKSGQALYIENVYDLNPTMDTSVTGVSWSFLPDNGKYGIAKTHFTKYCQELKLTLDIE